MGKTINDKKSTITQLLNENTKLKNINKTLSMELAEQAKIVFDLKVKITGLQKGENDAGGEPERNGISNTLTFVKTKSGRRKYVSNIDPKFTSVANVVRKELLVLANHEVSENEPFVEEDGTFAVEKGVERKWSGRIEVIKGDKKNAGLLPFFEGPNGHVPICPLAGSLKHGMYVPSTVSTEEFLREVTEMTIESMKVDWGNDEKLTSECADQISRDKAMNNELKSRLSNSMGARKKACRNRFVSLLGFSFLTTRVRAKDITSVSQKKDYASQCSEFAEKVCGAVVMEGKPQYSAWRTKNAIDLCYSDMDDKKSIDGFHETDRLLKNMISYPVFSEYVNRDIANVDGVDDSSIAMLARVDTWIYVTCLFINSVGNDDLANRKRGSQKKFQEAIAQNLPLAVQELLIELKLWLCTLKEHEWALSCGIVGDEDDPFNNGTRDATKVVFLPSSSKYMLALLPEWVKRNISMQLGSLYDCYIGWFEQGTMDKEGDRCVFKEMNVGMYGVGSKLEKEVHESDEEE